MLRALINAQDFSNFMVNLFTTLISFYVKWLFEKEFNFFSPRSTWNNVSVNKYDSQKQTQNFVFWNCNNHNIEGEYTINRINSEGEKFLLIDLELYYNNMMITCISQHNKTLRILQFKLSEKLGTGKDRETIMTIIQGMTISILHI